MALALTALATVGSTAGTATADEPAAVQHRAVVDVPGTSGGTGPAAQRALLAHWSPERMAEALGKEQGARSGSVQSLKSTADEAAGGPYSTAVGKLFFDHANGTPDACTGTVVNSESEVLVLTAAHCLHEGPGGTWTKNQVFFPAYHDGSGPYGGFTAWTIGTSSLWSSGSTADYEHDYGIVVVNDDAKGDTVFDKAGGYQIANDMRAGNQASLIGYSGPPYDGKHQEFCQELVEPSAPPRNMWEVECPNMKPGSSGGPWLLNFNQETGAGFIGGLNSINDGAKFMASPRFDDPNMRQFFVLMEEIGEARPD